MLPTPTQALFMGHIPIISEEGSWCSALRPQEGEQSSVNTAACSLSFCSEG